MNDLLIILCDKIPRFTFSSVPITSSAPLEDPLSVKCTADQWMCKDRAYCIELKERCDNVTQCTDDSDEKDCPGRCDVVQCHNGKCLDDFKYQCDGVDDCGDNSDEFHCGRLIIVWHY